MIDAAIEVVDRGSVVVEVTMVVRRKHAIYFSLVIGRHTAVKLITCLLHQFAKKVIVLNVDNLLTFDKTSGPDLRALGSEAIDKVVSLGCFGMHSVIAISLIIAMK